MIGDMPAMHDHASDAELMQLLCAATGREETDQLFSEIFTRYHRSVVAWCFRLTHNRDASADLAQEILLKAYRYRHSFRGDSRLSTWLYAITRNHCLSAVKKRSGASVETVLSPRLRDSSSIPPDVAVERREMYASLGGLLTRSLEPLEVRIMALHYGFGVPLGEITRQLALANPSGAKAYIVNARRKLNTSLRRKASLTAAIPRTSAAPEEPLTMERALAA